MKGGDSHNLCGFGILEVWGKESSASRTESVHFWEGPFPSAEVSLKNSQFGGAY